MERPINEEELHAYVDGALSATRHAEVEEYLRGHADIAARVQVFAAQRAALRAALAPILEEPVPPELSLPTLIARHRRPASLPWRQIAASVLLLTLGGAAGWTLRGTSAETSGVIALAQEAADSYAVYTPDRARPVEIRATDRDVLAHWLSVRLDRSIKVPDLSAAGYRLMGGRLVATAHGPAGMFMYDNDHGMRLVLLVRAMGPDRAATMTEHSQGNVNGYAWAGNGLGCSLVGPAAPDVLHPLANEVRRQMGEGV
jgi:anti-sigma factor RsiW